MPGTRKIHSEAGGFTFIELLLSIIVITAMLVAVGLIVFKAMDSYSLISGRRDALQNARLAVNMMESELQTIQHPATDITAISNTSITFINGAGNTVTYSLVGTQLLRNADVLASNATNPTGFIYYTLGGAVTNDRTQIYRIHIRVEVDTGVASAGRVQINTNVYLRNRYYSEFIQL